MTLDRYFESEVFADDYTQMGLTKCGHLIILQSYNLKEVSSVIIYRDILKLLPRAIKKTLGKSNKSQTIYSTANCYGSEFKIEFDSSSKDILMFQGDNDVVTFEADFFYKFIVDLAKKPGTSC